MNTDAKNYLVFGAGASGLSVVEYCLKQNENVRVVDTRDIPPDAEKISTLLSNKDVSFGKINQQWIDCADVIVLSPGISPDLPELETAKELGIEIIGDIELFARAASKPYIAVTGSNGKSTVTMLAHDILLSQGLKVKACANIGEPALNVLNDNVDLFVLELSSFQLETCSSLAAQAAVVLNLSDDHLDRHGNFANYAMIKSKIYNHAHYRVFPRTAYAANYLRHYHADTSFGLDEPAEGQYGIIEDDSGRWLAYNDSSNGHLKIIQTIDLPLLGSTGELNVLAALALTHNFVSDYRVASDAIQNFKCLSHRCELVLEHNGVRWIDDSKGTNIGATVSAIESMGDNIILIVGGVYKGGDLDTLLQVARKSVQRVITFGRDKATFVELFNDEIPITETQSLSDCVEIASNIAQPGQTILLSPACASYDMFSNYIERGLSFQSLVKNKVKGDVDGRL